MLKLGFSSQSSRGPVFWLDTEEVVVGVVEDEELGDDLDSEDFAEAESEACSLIASCELGVGLFEESEATDRAGR